MVEHVVERAATDERADIAALNANFTAQASAARSAAVREANVSSAVEEARRLNPGANLTFACGDGADPAFLATLGGPFDAVVLVNVVTEMPMADPRLRASDCTAVASGRSRGSSVASPARTYFPGGIPSTRIVSASPHTGVHAMALLR